MPSLKEQANEALNNLRAHRGERGIRSKYVKRTPLRIMAMDRDLIVLWAMFRGWSDAVAASGIRTESLHLQQGQEMVRE